MVKIAWSLNFYISYLYILVLIGLPVGYALDGVMEHSVVDLSASTVISLKQQGTSVS